MNKGGFSWKRAVGVTRAKQQIARKTGIPLTKSGRQRKVGKMVTGGGCLLRALLLAMILILALAVPVFGATAPVYVPGCADDGGSAAVPRRTHVILQTTWLAKRKSQINDYLGALRFKTFVNGTSIGPTSSYWGEKFYSSTYGAWMVVWSYDAGTLARNATMRVRMRFELTKAVSDGWTRYDAGSVSVYRCAVLGR